MPDFKVCTQNYQVENTTKWSVGHTDEWQYNHTETNDDGTTTSASTSPKSTDTRTFSKYPVPHLID